ncbi:BOMB/KIRA PROTEINS [Salix koriyanagi]|uniref:BOMB/KIRA PROTEINS n=1 Tax=Salix koriyanagi TaxID=2511006 RepID=A0A9Q0YUS9_9ROSI|nr:BOMB/KIRA PROTEINS [Salix koriyanagi]
MKLTELSLAPTQFVLGKSTSSSSSESENNPSRKRKFLSDQHLLRNGSPIQASVDLHVRDPLPLDWEQCLDLQSGRMYYLNRKTLRKSWNWPKNQKLDLELNISSSVVSNCLVDQSSSFDSSVEASDKIHAPSNSNMVALACLNCHLLVILSKSSPSCPNCKHVHSLPTLQSPLLKVSPSKSLSTLSLMN